MSSIILLPQPHDGSILRDYLHALCDVQAATVEHIAQQGVVGRAQQHAGVISCYRSSLKASKD
jgi:hypothetical protein